MPYDIEAIRKKLKDSMAGKFADPDEFRPEKGKSTTEPIKYRFYILPPIMEGDKLKSGVVKRGMEQFFIAHANHWVNQKPYPCPRVWDHSECPLCSMGFSLLKDTKDDNQKRKIREQWMPATYYMVNIFFPNTKMNPEDLRNKVKFYNAPKTCFDLWSSALLKDNCGSPEDPEAFGVFYDERAAFMFELCVLKQGLQNSYKTSKFLSNGGKPQPMVVDKDGKPNDKVLTALLALRHDLWSKIEIPDMEKIKKLYAALAEGDDEPRTSSGSFDEDEVAGSKSGQKSPTKATESPAKGMSAVKEDKKPPTAKEAKEDEDDILSQLVDAEDPLAAETPLDGKADDATALGSENSEIDALLSQLGDND